MTTKPRQISVSDLKALLDALFAALPKSQVGLQVGDYWNNGGVLTRVESL